MQYELIDAMVALEHTTCKNDVWKMLRDYIGQYKISALVYRKLPSSDIGFTKDGNTETMSFSKGGEHQIGLIEFAYEREFVEPGFELEKQMFWKDTTVLPHMHENGSIENNQFTGEKTMAGMMFPVIAKANRKAIFILAFEDLTKRYTRQEILCITIFCQKVHQILTDLFLEEAQEHIHLSSRQREILVGIAQGKSNIDIATQTGLSRHTVDAYLRRVFLKIGVTDRTSAALVAISYDLVSKPHYCKKTPLPREITSASQ